MTELHYFFLGGKNKKEVTSVTLANNTVKSLYWTVPAGKRWLILGLRMVNCDNVTRNCQMDVWEATGTYQIAVLRKADVATLQGLGWPGVSSTTDQQEQCRWFPLILEAAETIRCYWAAGGASAGATDADGMAITYLEVDV